MNLATVICIGLVLALESVQGQGDSLRARCHRVSLDFQKCAKKAHEDYAKAMAAGDDGREAFTARKACNYITESVENCAKGLIGECNSEEKVQEMKDHQIANFEERLSKNDELWESEKCPAVKAYLERKNGGGEVMAQEQNPAPEPESEPESEPEPEPEVNDVPGSSSRLVTSGLLLIGGLLLV